jgi:hypothetical protein
MLGKLLKRFDYEYLCFCEDFSIKKLNRNHRAPMVGVTKNEINNKEIPSLFTDPL